MRSLHPFMKSEHFFCLNNRHALKSQLLIIDVAEKTHECQTFQNRAVETYLKNDTVKRMGNDFQLLIELGKGVSQMHGDGCLSPILGILITSTFYCLFPYLD